MGWASGHSECLSWWLADTSWRSLNSKLHAHSVQMTRRRDAYRGGSTIHIPSRDSCVQDDGPPRALAAARIETERERLAAVDSAGECAKALKSFSDELVLAFMQTERAEEAGGASGDRLAGLDWRCRLDVVIQLARIEGDNGRAKACQAMMGRLSELQRTLSWASMYPEDYPHPDVIYWSTRLHIGWTLAEIFSRSAVNASLNRSNS